jgi:hypothetical protein
MGHLLEGRTHFMFGGVLEPLPPHFMYDVLPSDLSITNHSPKLSQLHNPLGFRSASACSMLIMCLAPLLTSLNFVASTVTQAYVPVGVLLCMLVMLLDWNLGLFHKC